MRLPIDKFERITFFLGAISTASLTYALNELLGMTPIGLMFLSFNTVFYLLLFSRLKRYKLGKAKCGLYYKYAYFEYDTGRHRVIWFSSVLFLAASILIILSALLSTSIANSILLFLSGLLVGCGVINTCVLLYDDTKLPTNFSPDAWDKPYISDDYGYWIGPSCTSTLDNAELQAAAKLPAPAAPSTYRGPEI